jgi:glycosyltransferase involved in cell wall biosynthesis
MRVLKVWDSEYPWDVRAEKICRTLTEAGHEVHMVARNRDRRPVRQELPECSVHRLRPWRWAGETLDRASQFPAFFNPRWLALMFSVGRRHGVELVLVRDVPLAPTAIWAARLLSVPVVLDMAENYPAMIRDLWTTGATRRGDWLVRNPKAVAAVERWVLARVDHVLAMVEESRDRLVRMGVPEGRVTIVSNTPSLARLAEFEAIRGGASVSARRAIPDAGAPLRVVYLGLMEEARGVGTALEAVAMARREGTPIALDLIGDGRALAALQARARTLGLGEDAVRFHGFLPYRQALEDVARADAGLIPHFANESWQTTVPNKLFDYMSLGLPVVASDAAPVARILEETGAGVTFRDRDAADLARVLAALCSDPGRHAMGEAGRRAVRTHYNWEADAARLSRALERVRSLPRLGHS